MSTLQIIVMVIQVITALGLIVIVTLQSGKSSGLSGAIAGGNGSFMGKGKAKSRDAILASATKWVAAVFALTTFILCLL